MDQSKDEKSNAHLSNLQIDGSKESGYNSSQFFENEIACKWLSTVDAARFLRVTENALRIMVHRDQIKAYKLGRRLRFKLSDCEALFKRKGA